jgi:erythromycin esterase
MYFWTWRTEEVLAMVEWMRRFNMDPVHRAEGRQIEFTGFDMQFHKVPLGIVRDFLEKHAPESLRQFYRVSTAIEALDGRSPDLAQLNVTQEAWRECIRVVDTVGGAEVSVGENDEYAWARQNAQLIAQWLQGRSEVSGRDRAMAENVMWLRKRKPHAKIVLWAHNGHVSKRPLSMGGYLAAELGDRFAVFGFSSGAGTYRARAQKDRALGAFILEEPEIGSVEAVFAKSGVERFVLDLRRARDPASEGFWFNEPHGHRAVGAMEMRRQFRSHTIAQNYDFIVWLSSVEASAVLPEK